MYAGAALKQGYGGTGYSGEVRHFPDYASRMYYMEEAAEAGSRPERDDEL